MCHLLTLNHFFCASDLPDKSKSTHWCIARLAVNTSTYQMLTTRIGRIFLCLEMNLFWKSLGPFGVQMCHVHKVGKIDLFSRSRRPWMIFLSQWNITSSFFERPCGEKWWRFMRVPARLLRKDLWERLSVCFLRQDFSRQNQCCIALMTTHGFLLGAILFLFLIHFTFGSHGILILNECVQKTCRLIHPLCNSKFSLAERTFSVRNYYWRWETFVFTLIFRVTIWYEFAWTECPVSYSRS